MPLADVLVSIPEPRQARKKRRHLVETPVVAVCEVLAGADNLVEIEMWAWEKFEWFRRYLNQENGIASHDACGRLFGVIEAHALTSALRR